MPSSSIQQLLENAISCHQAGRIDEAGRLYRDVIAQDATNADALHYLGVIAHQTGQSAQAVELIRQAIAARPDYAEAYANLVRVLRAMGRADEAETVRREAAALSARTALVLADHGCSLLVRGDFNEAAVTLQRALGLNPRIPGAHYHLGNALAGAKRYPEAVAAYRQAIALTPRLPDAHNNLGTVLKLQGALDGAIASYRQATICRPDHVAAYNNLGTVLKDAGLVDEAIAMYRKAIEINLACVEAHSNLVYALHFHPDYDASAIAGEQRQWDRQHAEPLKQFILPHNNDRDPDRPLRVGYVSPDFRDHVVGRNLVPLFREHDRRQFHITCYSQVLTPDAMTGWFQGHCDRWRNIISLSDGEAAEQIRRDKIDILVDLTLHMAYNRLLVFAHKPAPVQATFAGYPSGTGMETIDYRLSDPYLDPPGDDSSRYVEKTIRLADSFWCYDPLDCRSIGVQPTPALKNGFVTFGSLNNFCKLNESQLDVWAEILNRVAHSRLILLTPKGSARDRTLAHLQKHGIPPERVEFVDNQGRAEYLTVYHHIDITLDTLPYNGHTTSLDSLWMGVPVVSQAGRTAAGRSGVSILTNLGLQELIVNSKEQYVERAVELANDLRRLSELRATLRTRMEQSPLMDARRFARNIETAYRQMWQTWCASKLFI